MFSKKHIIHEKQILATGSSNKVSFLEAPSQRPHPRNLVEEQKRYEWARFAVKYFVALFLWLWEILLLAVCPSAVDSQACSHILSVVVFIIFYLNLSHHFWFLRRSEFISYQSIVSKDLHGSSVSHCQISCLLNRYSGAKQYLATTSCATSVQLVRDRL